MREQQKTSPLIWVGCGCAVAIFVVAVSITMFGVIGVRKGKEFVERMEDPVARRDMVLETLNAESLPEGYHPMFGFSLPFLIDVALLSDRPPNEDGEPQGWDESGFIYLKMLSIGRQQEELEDFFAGRTDDPSVLRQNGINVRVRGDALARGEVDRSGIDEATARWVTYEGSIDMQGSSSDGATTLVQFSCPGKSQVRMGIWFGPLPEDDELAGTVADGERLAEFLQPLRPCA